MGLEKCIDFVSFWSRNKRQGLLTRELLEGEEVGDILEWSFKGLDLRSFRDVFKGAYFESRFLAGEEYISQSEESFKPPVSILVFRTFWAENRVPDPELESLKGSESKIDCFLD